MARSATQPNERDCHDHHAARPGRPSILASGPTAFLTGDTIKMDGGALVSAGV